MPTQEDEAGSARLFGGKVADHLRRVNESADHTFGANKPSEAAKRQGAELLPDRCPVTMSPKSKKVRGSEDASKGGLESPALWNRCPSPNRSDSIRSQDSFAGSTTTRSSTFQNTMSDSLGSLSMDTAPTSPTFDVVSQSSYSNTHSNMTSMTTSPMPSRKNTIDERSEEFVLEGNEVKRAKTEHYRASAASTRMATDLLAHFPTHTKSFPLTNTYLIDRNWPELMHMQAGMDIQWRNVAPRRPKPGFLALTPVERRPAKKGSGPLPKIGSTELPFRLKDSSNSASVPAPDQHNHGDKHTTEDITWGKLYSLNNRLRTPTPLSSCNTPSSSPEMEESARSSAPRPLVVCDSYGDAYYDVICQAIHNLILEHTPTAVLEDLEKPLKMAAVWCTEKATNMIQEKLCNLSCTERVVTDCSGDSHGSSRSRPHGPSHAASAPAIPKYTSVKRNGKSNNRRGDEDSGDDTNNNEDPEHSNGGSQDYGHGLKRNRTSLSCPFRKRNPLRYNIRDWSSCALQYFANITLLKRHIRSYHKLNQSEFVCRRCKQDMGHSERLEKHMNVPLSNMCDSVAEAPLADPEDGISREIDEILCARDNGRKVDTWGVLWRTLFPKDGHPPSQDFDPPVGLEEVANRFDRQHKELPPTSEGLPLPARLHTSFQETYILGVDPGQFVSIANDVCHGYIKQTLEDSKKIPYENSQSLDAPSTSSFYRPMAPPGRVPKKPGGPSSRPLAKNPAVPSLSSRNTNGTMQQPSLMNAAAQPLLPRLAPFSGLSVTNESPNPWYHNPRAGYLDSSITKAQSGTPSLSTSTNSTGSPTYPQPQHGSTTPCHEPNPTAIAIAPSTAFAHHTDGSPLENANYMLTTDSFYNNSESGYANLPPVPLCLEEDPAGGFGDFAQSQTEGGEVITDPAMPVFPGDHTDPSWFFSP